MLTGLHSIIRRYFSYSTTETRGFIVLIIVFIAMLSAPALINKFLLKNNKDVNNQEFIEQWKAEVQSLIGIDSAININPRYTQLMPFLFDPNTLSLQGFDSIGLNKRLSTTILNYREKGGQFRIKSDLKKIYGLSDALFTSLYDYIDLPETYAPQKKSATKRTPPKEQQLAEKHPPIQININTASANDLQVIKGIGNVLSTRIISFRDALGGFRSIDQLGEVYGLNDTVVNLAKNQFYVEQNYVPALIDLTNASEEILRKHPYVDYRMARIISSFTQQHQISDVKDIKEIKIMTDSLFGKIAPYLFVSNHGDSIP